MKWIWPSATDRRPKLVENPPLAPVTRSSVIVIPAAIALTAIREAMESAAPRDLSDKPDNPVVSFDSNVGFGWSVARNPFVVTGRSDGLTVSTALSGSLHAAGQFGLPDRLQDQLQDQLESFFGGGPGRPRAPNQRDR